MGLYVGDKAVKKILNGDNYDVKGITTKDKGIFPKKISEVIEFNFTGADQHWTAPDSGKLIIECWGAGAGGGGKGGYAKGTISVRGGDEFSIVCGARGNSGGRYGFAGASNQSNAYDGGGLSGVFTGSAAVGGNDAARALVIGGGAGGNGAYGQGGNGGGETGGNGGAGGGCGTPGDGGTQTGHGARGNRGGTQFQGGGASGTRGSGGGGGWRGGNGSQGDSSAWDDQSAGGGSGYVIASATDKVLTQGGGAATGANGKVVLTFLCEPHIEPATYVTQAGIYHNPDLGLISMSSDGENWVTIADKNVGATSCDPTEQNSYGKTFQYGNIYGFPGEGDSTAITTSSAIPSLSGYEGGNLYSDSTYRTNMSWLGRNTNLWKGIAFTNLKSLEKGPCPLGFHVPTVSEFNSIVAILQSIIGEEEEITLETLETYFLMSHPKVRKGSGSFSTDYIDSIYGTLDVELDHDIHLFGGASLSPGLSSGGTILGFLGFRIHQYSESSALSIEMGAGLANTSMYIRPFRDKAMIPTTEWIRLSPGGHARLPHEYQEVEYIESTGTQYLNLGFTPPSNYLKTEIKLYNTATGDKRAGGAYDGSNRANVHYIGLESLVRGGFGNNDFQTNYPYSVNTLYQIEMEANSGTWRTNVNGTQATGTYGGTVQVSTSRPYFLFANQENGNPGEYFNGRIYYFKATTSEGLIRDLVPCFRVSDGVVGMYDMVDGTFYTNQGTGAFVMGPSVNAWQMPDGYTELQYIQSSGASNTDGQYVDTGYMPNNNTEFELSMSNWSNASGSFQLFGQDTSWTTGDQGTSVVTDNYSWNGPNANTFTHGFRDGNFHLLLLNNSGLYRDGTLVHNGRAGQTFQSSVTCAIFCLHRGTAYTERSSYRFHYMRIRESGDLKRDYIPCMRDSDGVLGLYDLVTHTFLTNQGTGSFVAGPVVFRGGFKVSPNTKLYVKMDTDLIDHSGKDVNVTNSGVTLNTSVADVGAGYFDGNSRLNFPSSFFNMSSSDFTISFWCRDGAGLGTNHGSIFNNQWTLYSSLLLRYTGTKLYGGTRDQTWDIWSDVAAFDINQDTWVLWTMTRQGSNWKIYKNNVLFWSGTSSASLNYNANYTGAIGGHEVGNPNYYIGYISDFIVEQGAWSDQQREDYFKATKALYGVS